MLRGRPCNSGSRAKNRYTRDELVNLAEEFNYEITRGATISKICNDLREMIEKPRKSKEKKIPKKLKIPKPKRRSSSPKPEKKKLKIPKPKPSRRSSSPKSRERRLTTPDACESRKECKNEDDLYASLIKDIPDDKFIKIKSSTGMTYCYDIDQLIQLLTTSKVNRNPYDRQPIWNNEDEFNKILSHPAVNEADRRLLRNIFFFKGISENVLNAIVKNYSTFEKIGIVGMVLYNDQSDHFKPSLSALAYLDNEIEKLPRSDKILFLNEIPLITVNSYKSIGDIIKNAHEQCIHGVGQDLIKIFLFHWFELPLGSKKPLPNVFVQLPLKRAVAIILRHENSREMPISIYLHDEETHGIKSTLSYEFRFVTGYIHEYQYASQLTRDLWNVLRQNVGDNFRHLWKTMHELDKFIQQNGIEPIKLPWKMEPEYHPPPQIRPLILRFPMPRVPIPQQFILQQIKIGGRSYRMTQGSLDTKCREFRRMNGVFTNPFSGRRISNTSETWREIDSICRRNGI